MKVNSIQANNMINAYNKQKQTYKTNTTIKTQSDKVIISEDAKYLSKINSTDNDNVNINKINEIKKQLKEGTYNIDAGKIAHKMMKAIKGE